MGEKILSCKNVTTTYDVWYTQSIDDPCHHFPSGVPWDALVEGFDLTTHTACMIPT